MAYISLSAAVSRLRAKRDERIMRLRRSGKKLIEIAREVGLTKERVRQILATKGAPK